MRLPQLDFQEELTVLALGREAAGTGKWTGTFLHSLRPSLPEFARLVKDRALSVGGPLHELPGEALPYLGTHPALDTG